MVTPRSNPACGHVDDSEHPCGHICPQPRTDKPRADLVALFDAFAVLPPTPGTASLSLFGGEHESAFRTWAAQRGLRVQEQPLANATEGRWTALSVDLAGGYITIHLDSVQEQPDRDEDGNRVMDPAEVAAREGSV